tara:strand:- start:3204 stop:4193 length:990 start_codon:yes stop_codon:yes gene_type:complete
MNESSLETFSLCRKLYKDILLGYNYIPSHDFYIKHFQEIDIGYISELKQKISDECKAKGLLSEEEKVDLLIEGNLWTKEKNQEIQSLTEQIANHQQAKTKLFIKAQVNSVQRQIDTKTKKLNELLLERDDLTGLTLEKFSEKKSSEQVIRLALFKDKKLKKSLFSEEEYDELEPNELNNLIEIYSITISQFTEQRLKMISAASFFMNALMVCKNNPFTFFGLPVTKLTNFQMEIFSTGLSFKSILEKGNSPSVELHSDLEKMVEWYESSGHVEKMTERAKDKDGSTMMGATKEELRMMTHKDDKVIDLHKEAELKGGELNMKDFIRIHS